MKKIISLMLVIAMCLSMTVPTMAAYTPQYTNEAEALFDLGLFKGKGTNADGTPKFALEQEANRLEGLVMLIRLLGEEDAALAFTGECPFADVPNWGKPYVAYAYAQGYTKGASATSFGSDDALLGKMFITFILRALGYDDKAGDFSYNDALNFGATVGLVSNGAYTGNLYRDDCAHIMYVALNTEMKGGNQTLKEKLVADGVFASTLEIPFERIDGSLRVDYSKVKELFPEAYYLMSWDAGGNQNMHLEAMSNPYRYFLNHLIINRYVTEGESPLPFLNSYSSLVVEGEYTVFSKGQPDRINFVELFDKNGNMLAYAAVQGDCSKVYPTTVCTEKYMDKLKSNMKAFDNAKRFNQDIASLEKTVTFLEGANVQTNTILCLDEKKLALGKSVVDSYVISSSPFGSPQKTTWYNVLSGMNTLIDYGSADADLTRNLTWYMSQKDEGGMRHLQLYDANMNILAYCDLNKGMTLIEYADFGNGKVACTIAEKDALDILAKTVNSVGGDKAEAATKKPYDDAVLAKYIYLYRTKNCTQSEYIANITAWLNG